jgi:hypothetical protein
MFEANSEGTKENSSDATTNKPHWKLLVKKNGYIAHIQEIFSLLPTTHLKS